MYYGIDSYEWHQGLPQKPKHFVFVEQNSEVGSMVPLLVDFAVLEVENLEGMIARESLQESHRETLREIHPDFVETEID